MFQIASAQLKSSISHFWYMAPRFPSADNFRSRAANDEPNSSIAESSGVQPLGMQWSETMYPETSMGSAPFRL